MGISVAKMSGILLSKERLRKKYRGLEFRFDNEATSKAEEKKRSDEAGKAVVSKNAWHNLSRAKSAARSEVRNVNVGSRSRQPVRMRHPPRSQSPPEKW